MPDRTSQRFAISFTFSRLLLLALAAAAALSDEAAAQGSSCGTLVPGQVDPVEDATVTLTTTESAILQWNPPDYDFDRAFFYIVSCPSCPIQEVNTTDTLYTFTNLRAATEYSFSVQAGLENCTLSTPSDVSGKTQLTALQGPVEITDVKETSFNVRWTASLDPGVEYEVSCAGRVQTASAVCSGQESGARIQVSVTPVKAGGWMPGGLISGTALTKLFAIDASSAQINTSETVITASWQPSNTSGVFYQLTCTQTGSGSVTQSEPSNSPSATCSPLQSGEKYNVSVAVKKDGGFDDAVTQLPNQLTKIGPISNSSAQFNTSETAISVSWTASSTAGVSYQLTCTQAGSGSVTQSELSTSPSATCSSLQSGAAYSISVAVKKDGGFDDAVTELPDQLTKLFAIDANSVLLNTSHTAIFATWTASSTADVWYQLTCVCTSSGHVAAVNVTSPSATCSNLQSGEKYNVSVAVKKDGGFDDAVTQLPDQLTKLFAINASSAHINTSQTVITASWQPSKTSGVSYQLTCTQTGSGSVTKSEPSNSPSASCGPLQSGESYNISVAVKKDGGFEDAVTQLSGQLTKLFAIDANSTVFWSNETAVSVNWTASATAGVSYQLVCLPVSFPGDIKNVSSSSPSAACGSLQSGEAYNLSVAVQKQGGFDSAVTQLPTQLTKLFSINASSASYSVNESAIAVSWTASATNGVLHQLRCQLDNSTPAVARNVTSAEQSLSAICDSLLPGRLYSLQLAVMKDGGYEDAVTELDGQLTFPVLSSDLANFQAAEAAELSNSSATLEAFLRLNWTDSAADGADYFLVRVTDSSATAANLVDKEVPFSSKRALLSLTEFQLFSLKLSVSFAAVANKSGLRQQSHDVLVAEQLQMPPNRPLLTLTVDKRAVSVNLTASSSSELLQATGQADGSASAAVASCRPDPVSRSCIIALHPLRPYTNYSVESVAEFSNLTSLSQTSQVRTLEDAPSQPQSVKLNNTSSRLLCEWRSPDEPNGVIRNFTAKWGSLNFTDSAAELPDGVRTVLSNEFSLELAEPLPGVRYFCRVSACTGGGCGNGSDRAELKVPDGDAAAVTELMPQAVPGESVRLSWAPLNASMGRGVVFEYALRVADADGGCVTARLLNCSDCGRDRLQLQSDEARQRLDNLTRDCAEPAVVKAFSFYEDSLTLNVSVSSAGASPSSLRPWTVYNATLWPVNLAGPGPGASISFRSPETRSEAVRNLRVAPSDSEALVEFEEPRLANGLLQVFAVQLFTTGASPACTKILLLNSTSASDCQLPETECRTTEIINQLIAECKNSASVVTMETGLLSNDVNSSVLTVRLQQLPSGTEFEVRVTPVSQTLAGYSTNFKFVTPGGGGGGGNNNNIVTILVAVIVSVVLVLAIAAAVLVFVWQRRRKPHGEPNQPTPMTPVVNGAQEHANQNNRLPNTYRATPVYSPPPPPPPPPPPKKKRPPPSPTAAPAAEFAAYARSMLADAACLSDQQYSLLKQSAAELTNQLSSEDGLAGNNREKNRYINILPFDNNRVKLSGDQDYINASYVRDTVDDDNDGDGFDRAPFIACQGPKPITVSDHWRMIWEKSVPVTVMLTACVEKGRTKCEQYWPEAEGDSLTFDWGLRVSLITAENVGQFIVRKLRLIYNPESADRDNVDEAKDAGPDGTGSRSMETELLQYVEWEDHAVPNLDNLADFLSRVHAVQRQGADGGRGPIAVHCSAGVGRTGTFIALDVLARRLQHIHDLQLSGDSSLVSVYETVLQLRRCRVEMVQTKHQYAFIYRFLLNFIEKNLRIDAATDNNEDADRSNDPVYATAVPSKTVNDNKAFEGDE